MGRWIHLDRETLEWWNAAKPFVYISLFVVAGLTFIGWLFP